jgi:hypothetical protein
LLACIFRGGLGLLDEARHIPRILWLVARLGWTKARISYWRYRNRRSRSAAI